jgi:hypothetical protein
MKQILLTQDQFSLVDDDDFKALSKHKWYAIKTSYGYTAARSCSCPLVKQRPTILMHRQITSCPRDMDVDHINHQTLDNRKLNLRICTHSQNLRNMLIHKSNSQFKGCNRAKQDKKWRARITINYKEIHLGYFNSEKDAAKAYDRAAIKHFGEFAKTNF